MKKLKYTQHTLLGIGILMLVGFVAVVALKKSIAHNHDFSGISIHSRAASLEK